MRPPRYPLLLRLAHIESELSAALRLMNMVTEDVLDTVGTTREIEQRVMLMAAVTGSALMVAGLDGKLVFAWVAAMEPGGDAGEIDRLTGQLVQQIVTAYGPVQGRG